MKAHTWNGASYTIAYSALICLAAAAVVSGYLEEVKWKPTDNCELDGLHYLCLSGKCIPKEWLCDGTFDCPNNDDELHETCNPKGNLERGNCPARQFECVSPSGEKRCAREEWRCDGNRDCANGIDEEGCETTTTPTTSGVRVTTTARRNVSEAKRTPEPLMAFDEKNSTTCDNAGKFRCTDGQCIAASDVCNGKADCADGSDELPGKCAPAPAPPVPAVQSAAVNNPFADAELLFGPKTTTSSTGTTRTTTTSVQSSSATTKVAGTASSKGATSATAPSSSGTTALPSRSSASTSNPTTATTTTTVRPKPIPQREEPQEEEAELEEPLKSEVSNGSAASGATLSKSSEAKPVEAAIGTPIISKDDEYATGSDGQTSFTRKTPTVYPAFQYAGDHREFLKSHPPPQRGP